jgi:hypothetical protein
VPTDFESFVPAYYSTYAKTVGATYKLSERTAIYSAHKAAFPTTYIAAHSTAIYSTHDETFEAAN